MKKYRSLFIILGVIMVVVVALVVLDINFRSAQWDIPVSTISDGSGGAIIAWQNNKGIHVQHVDLQGNVLWQKGGLLVTNTKEIADPFILTQTDFTMVTDGAGGAIIAWAGGSSAQAKINSTAYFSPLTIYVQRITADGKIMWNQTAVSTGDNWEMIPDGEGGVIIAWDNFKPFSEALHDDYLCLQKISSNGSMLWGNTGLTLVKSSPFHSVTGVEISGVNSRSVDRSYPTYTGTQDIVTDGAGGVMVIWDEEGESDANQVFEQRVDSQGNPVWTDSTLVGNGTYQYNSLRTDGLGGAFLALQAKNQGVIFQVQVGHNGELEGLTQYYPYEVGDGSGGSISASIDLVHPVMSSSLIYDTLSVQRLDAEGSQIWPEKQVFSSQLGYQILNLNCISDDNEGIFLSWQLIRGDIAYGITYAQRLDAAGNILFGNSGINVFGMTDTYQGRASALSDGSGGIFVVAPISNGAFGGNSVCVQHMNLNGDRLWGKGIRIDQ
jgi:hypothetical protein